MRLPDKKEAYGEVPDRFRILVAAALLEEERPMKAKRIPVMLLAAILILALAATALAVTLRRSAQFSAAMEARQAIMDTYGFTREALGLFVQEIVQRGDTYTFHYIPIKHGEKLGDYTAVVKEGEVLAVTWTNDGEDPALWASGDLGDEIWGAVQAEKYLNLELAYNERMAEIVRQNEKEGKAWSDENQAEVDAMLLEANLTSGVYGSRIGALPSADDIQQEEAIAIATKALTEKYGVSEDFLSQYEPHVFFTLGQAGAEATYQINFSTADNEWHPETGFLSVLLLSPSGKVTESFWSVDKHYRTLPDGALDSYHDAVKEFIEHGALDVLPHAEKAELTERIMAAGYPFGIEYLAPKETDISEAEAVRIAKEALLEKRGLTEAMLTLFEPTPAFYRLSQEPTWVINFPPREDLVWPVGERLGEYRVAIVGATGEVLGTYWTFASYPHDTSVYTESTWGQSPICDVKLLPWVFDFVEAHALLDAMGEERRWSLEGNAMSDQLFRDAGFDRTQYYIGLPEPEDIPQEQALLIAKEALAEAYGLTESTLENQRMGTSFSVADPEQPQWIFTWFIGGNGSCFVYINARTGDVDNIQYLMTGNG